MPSGRTIALAAVAVLIGTAGLVYVASQARLARRFPASHETVRAATDSAGIAHGRHLASVICAKCDGPDLGGQIMIDAMPFARLYAPNLTAGAGGAAGRSPRAAAGVRSGRTDAALSDGEIGALYAYLRTVPPRPYGQR